MGEFIAWIIGWGLVLEYALGAATVSIAWSEYLNKLLETVFHVSIPYEWCHSPFQTSPDGVSGLMNVPALLILLLLSAVLIRGTKESAFVNGIIVIVKVAIVLLFIAIGWGYMTAASHDPYIPARTVEVINGKSQEFGGWMGIISAAGVVFFAFIGFDAVSTAAQEAKDPQRSMPKGILISLAVCTVLDILFAHVLTGVANYTEFRTSGKEASVAYAIDSYMKEYQWLGTSITVAILAGFSRLSLLCLWASRECSIRCRKTAWCLKFSPISTRSTVPHGDRTSFSSFSLDCSQPSYLAMLWVI